MAFAGAVVVRRVGAVGRVAAPLAAVALLVEEVAREAAGLGAGTIVGIIRESSVWILGMSSRPWRR